MMMLLIVLLCIGCSLKSTPPTTLTSAPISNVGDVALTFGPPIQKGKWKETPAIIVCPTAPVAIHRVQQAVDVWKSLGYNIGEVIEADVGDFSCERDIVLYGDILIDVMNYNNNNSNTQRHLGNTRTWADRSSGEIFKAKIEVMSGWGTAERIIEHELGHALGWQHYNQLGHLMHSEWSKGGDRTQGLKK